MNRKPTYMPQCYDCHVVSIWVQYTSFSFIQCPNCKLELEFDGMPKGRAPKEQTIKGEDKRVDYWQFPKDAVGISKNCTHPYKSFLGYDFDYDSNCYKCNNCGATLTVARFLDTL